MRSEERQARNEALYRNVNEQLASLDRRAGSWAGGETLFEFVCECGRGEGCGERVRMTISEYDRVRGQDDRFAVVPGHESDEIELVVERHDRYLVVDKRPEVEALVADDPRGAPSR